MKHGYMSSEVLKLHLEKMCLAAKQMPIGVPFGIEDLFTTDEWENITQYGHVTLGQQFCSRVETGKVANVYLYGDQRPLQYIRR